MMAGYFAGLAAQALAETEARLQRQEADRQFAAQVEQFDNLAQRMRQGDVIDVEAREVPDVLALAAPPTKYAPPSAPRVAFLEGSTMQDTEQPGQSPEPNPELIQDRGRERLVDLLENGKTDLLNQPPADTTELPPGHEEDQTPAGE